MILTSISSGSTWLFSCTVHSGAFRICIHNMQTLKRRNKREKHEYQLEKEIMRNALEKMDIFNDREEQIVCNTQTNSFWQTIQCVLMFQSFCSELETSPKKVKFFSNWTDKFEKTYYEDGKRIQILKPSR
ncbi:unnamed protein product [Camellia sinensis]